MSIFQKILNKKGSEMIEFVILVPMLLFLIFGAISYMFAVYAKIVVVDAAREGARAEALQTGTADQIMKDVIKEFGLKESYIQEIQVQTVDKNGTPYIDVSLIYKQPTFFPLLPGAVTETGSVPSNFFRLRSEATFKKEKL